MLAEKINIDSNIISFTEYCNDNKSDKLTLDGRIKKTHCNKVAGTSSEVYAFKSKEDISAIIDILDLKIVQAPNAEKKWIASRNKLLFLLGINIGIRASDIRLLKWSFFFDEDKNGELVFKDSYSLQPVKTKKTGKYVEVFFNDVVKMALHNYLDEYPFEDIDSYVFMGREGKPITVQQMWNIIKGTAKEAGIKQNIGSHSLRKTFGYHAYHNAEDKSEILTLLQAIFNHSSKEITMRYIGLTNREIKKVFNMLNLGMENMKEHTL